MSREDHTDEFSTNLDEIIREQTHRETRQADTQMNRDGQR
jgi:hypothetical protein